MPSALIAQRMQIGGWRRWVQWLHRRSLLPQQEALEFACIVIVLYAWVTEQPVGLESRNWEACLFSHHCVKKCVRQRRAVLCAEQMAAVPSCHCAFSCCIHPILYGSAALLTCCLPATGAPCCELVLTRLTTFQSKPKPVSPAPFAPPLIHFYHSEIGQCTAMWAAGHQPAHQSGKGSPATPPPPSPGTRRLMCPTLLYDHVNRQRRSAEAGKRCWGANLAPAATVCSRRRNSWRCGISVHPALRSDCMLALPPVHCR